MGIGYGPGDPSFEQNMRAGIIAAANSMNNGGTDFSDFKNSRCNPRFWTRTDNGGFQLNQGVAPSAAIEDIFENGSLYAFECAMAMVMILYKATIGAIGASAFDRHFGDIFLWDWNYDSNLQMITTFERSDMQPGDVVYFKNPDHDPRKPEWQGENAIMLGGDRYYGHGLGIKSASEMIAALNRHRVPGSRIPAYFTDEALHPNFAYISGLSMRSGLSKPGDKGAKGAIFSRIGVKTYINK